MLTELLMYYGLCLAFYGIALELYFAVTSTYEKSNAGNVMLSVILAYTGLILFLVTALSS